MVAVVCINGGVVSGTDDVRWRHSKVAVFVEASGMFDAGGVDYVVWKTFGNSREGFLFLHTRLTHVGVNEVVWFFTAETKFATPRPVMTTHDVSSVGCVVIGLYFTNALAIADSATMELTAFLVF